MFPLRFFKMKKKRTKILSVRLDSFVFIPSDILFKCTTECCNRYRAHSETNTRTATKMLRALSVRTRNQKHIRSLTHKQILKNNTTINAEPYIFVFEHLKIDVEQMKNSKYHSVFVADYLNLAKQIVCRLHKLVEIRARKSQICSKHRTRFAAIHFPLDCNRRLRRQR